MLFLVKKADNFAAFFMCGFAASCLRTLGTRRSPRLATRENLSQIYLLLTAK